MLENFSRSSLILVTGANGHVAQHVISQLLSRPESTRPRVRATVQSESSASGLKSVFAADIESGSLVLEYVPDIAIPGAFDSAVRDCTHIAHIASPLVVGAKDVENDVLVPAIQGTTGLLKSAMKAPSIKVIVITSSFAAIFDPMHSLRPGFTYTSYDWLPISYEIVADPHLDLSPWPPLYQGFITYMASKKLAEEAAWKLYNEAKPTWRLSVINPTYIGGPNVLPLAKGADGLSFSQGLIWKIAMSKPGDNLTEVDFPYWVDVRDVAKAHIQALISPSAVGKRFILAPHRTTYAKMASVLREKFGLDCSTQEQDLDCFDCDMKETETLLGIKDWLPFEDMICDTVRDIL